MSFTSWLGRRGDPEPDEPSQLETSGPHPLDAARDVAAELALIEEQRRLLAAADQERRNAEAEQIADYRRPRLDGPIGRSNDGWRW